MSECPLSSLPFPFPSSVRTQTKKKIWVCILDIKIFGCVSPITNFFFYALCVSRGSSSREGSVPLAISPPLAVPPARSSRYKGALDFDSVCLRCFGIPPPAVAGSREHKTSTVCVEVLWLSPPPLLAVVSLRPILRPL